MNPALGPGGPRWAQDDDDGRAGIALVCGLAAAIAGGAAWAAIVLFSRYEIGWAAWGVGALVGFAIVKVTAVRGRTLGVAAAALAALGLLLGKLLITQWSVGGIAHELVNDPEGLRGAVAWHMYATEELEEEVQAAVTATLEAGDTLSDALWAAMTQQAGARLAAMSEAEQHAAARGAAQANVGRLGVLDAILVQFGPWDLLWFGLALATAYRLVAHREPEPAARRT